MARTVILTFRDNDIAEAVVSHLLDAEDAGADWHSTYAAVLGTLLASGAEVDAVIARPTAFCRCPGNKKGQYKKTTRFGWWIHNGCNKPSWLIVRDFIKNMIGGYNNLLPELQRKEDSNGVESVGQ